MAIGWEEAALQDFLERNSALPGPRANLELAHAFAQFASTQPTAAADTMLLAWAGRSAEEAPFGGRGEFIPFVAVFALGVRVADPGARDRCLAAISMAAHDTRWRLREAAAIALQILGERDSTTLRHLAAKWVGNDPWHLRAAMVGLSHPPLLTEPATLALAWSATDRAMALVRAPGNDGPPDVAALRSLSQALAFVPSVLVAAAPDEGFRRLARWADYPDIASKKLVMANLRKARLAKKYPEACTDVAERLSNE